MLSDLSRAELRREWAELHRDAVAETVVLKRLKVAASRTVAASMFLNADFTVTKEAGFIADELVMKIVARVTAQSLGGEAVRLEVTYPRDWWQHFKERWFPAWARYRWPVLYTTKFQSVELKRYMLYPDFPLPGHKGYATVIPGPVFTESDDA